MSVGKKLMITLGSETQTDERAMWIWVVAEGRQARQTRNHPMGRLKKKLPSGGEGLLLDPKIFQELVDRKLRRGSRRNPCTYFLET